VADSPSHGSTQYFGMIMNIDKNTTPMANERKDNVCRAKMTFLVQNLSEHSLRFYNGAYQWNSDGYTDENGGKLNCMVM
jgi:hypothetical protein